MEEIIKKITAPLSLFLLILSAFFIFAIVEKSKEIGKVEQGPTITISGSAEKYVSPDLALISFSVVTEKETVEEAMTKNTEKMNKVIEAIKGKAVAKEDIKTINFSIRPRYDWLKNDARYPGGKRILVGYEVNQGVQVKIRNMEMIGDIIDSATQAGANEASGLSFTVENDEEIKEQVRAEAIKKAKEKAKILAGQVGVKLGKIINFSESSGSAPPIFRYDMMMAEEMSKVGGATPQIEEGQNKVEVSVSITYKIK